MVDLFDVDFREDDLFGDTETVVATAIEAFVVDAPEVADTWEGDADETFEKFVHLVTAQCHMHADRVATAELEVADVVTRDSRNGF